METFVFILLGLLGVMLHIVMKFRDAISKEPKNGKTTKERLALIWKNFDVLGNITYGIFAFILVIVVVIARDKMEDIFPITHVSIIFVGYMADSVIKNIKPDKLKQA